MPRKRDAKHHLADLLRLHPEIEFDLEEYVFSTRFRRQLESRFAAFMRGMRSAFSLSAAEAKLLARLRSGALTWVPAYQGYSQMRNFQDLPLVQKQDLRESPSKYVASNYPVDDLVVKSTTGSSGAPIQIWHSASFYFEGLILSLQKIAAFLKQDRSFSTSVFCLALSDDRAKKDFALVDPTERSGIVLRSAVDEQNVDSYDRAKRILEQYRPACISSKPSILEVLASRGLRCGRSQHLRFAVSSGAKLETTLRKELKKLLRCHVTEAYGLTEFGVVAYPCTLDSLHIDTSSVFVEIIDDTGSRVPDDNEGEIVLSSLANKAMPLLRYRTGDIGRISSRCCSCGSESPVIAAVSGRVIRAFRLPSGRRFAPTYFNDLFTKFPFLKEFQITQTGRLDFQLKAEIRPGVAEEDHKLEQVRSYIERSLPESVRVDAVNAEALKDDKFQRFRCSV